MGFSTDYWALGLTFVELITGGHLEALVVQDISPLTWFHNKPRSTQCDIVCRWVFPPIAAITSIIILSIPLTTEKG